MLSTFQWLTVVDGTGTGVGWDVRAGHGTDCEVEMPGDHSLHRPDDMGVTVNMTRRDNRE
jgi:hypothetical protein